MTPQNTPLEISEACCAHTKVVYKRVNHPEGGCSDSWICPDCDQNFRPAGMTTALTAKLREENESLQKQISGLRKVLQLCRIASCTCMTKSPDIKFHCETCRYRKVEECLADSTNFSHLYIRREALEKLFQKWDCVYNLKWDHALQEFDEALTLARKEIGE